MYVVAHSGEVGVASARLIVQAAGGGAFGGVVRARGGVGFVCWRGVGEIGVYRRALVGGLRVDVAEAAAGGEARDGYLVVAYGAGAWREVGGA